MTKWSRYLVVAIDGSQAIVTLPKKLCHKGIKAPRWLLHQMGFIKPRQEQGDWYLQSTGHSSFRVDGKNGQAILIPKLCLARTVTAAAIPYDPRQARLGTERQRLEKLNEESDYVRVKPIEVLEGSEPEHYQVTFLCQGIVGIDSSQKPIYGERHEVEISCDEDFPADVPRLRWMTPIWHPNIQHEEPKGVCVNKSEWLGGMGLDDLCRQMFEMVQYKNYHAEYTQPYPLDSAVAKWVLEYAEPQGIVNKEQGIFVDDKPFTRPTVSTIISVAPSTQQPKEPRIKLRESTKATKLTKAANKPEESRIKIVGSEKKPVLSETKTPSSENRIKILKKE